MNASETLKQALSNDTLKSKVILSLISTKKHGLLRFKVTAYQTIRSTCIQTDISAPAPHSEVIEFHAFCTVRDGEEKVLVLNSTQRDKPV